MRQIVFKYYSTFDSTAEGNIGPVAEALAAELGVAGVICNKRTAWVVARLFLALNEHRLVFLSADAVAMVEDLAAGKLDESQLAAWFRERIAP